MTSRHHVKLGGPRVIVIGAGIVGLSVAWFLQEDGAEVTVLDARHPNAGASWGNAGWIAPALTTPLPNPTVLSFGLRSILDRRSPLFVPLGSSLGCWSWLIRFARNCSPARYAHAQSVLAELSVAAQDAYAYMSEADPQLALEPRCSFLMVFTSHKGLTHALDQFSSLERLGVSVKHEVLTASDVHSRQPGLTGLVHSGLLLDDQDYLNPPEFVAALDSSVRRRGGRVVPGARVTDLQTDDQRVVVDGRFGPWEAEHAVIATGAALSTLAAPYGVKARVQSGRGYSFSTSPTVPVHGPVYFPDQRIACTPLNGRLRVGGMMEFRPSEARLDPARLQVLRATLREIFPEALNGERLDEWVGARPCTADGLPLLGRTRDPRVHVAGGHGMWGVTLGPVSGKLLAKDVIGAASSTTLSQALLPTR